MKKRILTKDQQIKKLKRDNIRFQIEIIVIFLLLLALFFFNYNYTIFKILIAGCYTDTNALDSIYSEAIDAETDGFYYKNFDNVIISLFMDRLYEENNDRFTMLFNKGELKTEQNEMELDSKKTEFKKLNNTTGCITLTAFSSPSGKIIKDNIEEIASCDNIIIDLRDNPGGVLKYADSISEYFLPKDSIIAQYNCRSRLLSSVSVSKNSSPLQFDSIYILQNQYTASAAEVFINALRENLNNVTVIGSPSYGKGIGQTEMKLLYGFGIKATTLDILTPNGNSINHTGIKPDITPYEDELDYALNLVETG